MLLLSSMMPVDENGQSCVNFVSHGCLKLYSSIFQTGLGSVADFVLRGMIEVQSAAED